MREKGGGKNQSIVVVIYLYLLREKQLAGSEVRGKKVTYFTPEW